MTITIYSSHHEKPCFPRVADLFVPIWTGGEADPGKRWLTDLQGVNIHSKTSYNEMRQEFFVWRNLLGQSEYVGFEHYRRPFLLDPRNIQIAESRYPSVLAARKQMAANVLMWHASVEPEIYADYVQMRQGLSARERVDIKNWIKNFDMILSRPYPGMPIVTQWRQCGLSMEIWDRFIAALESSSYWQGRTNHIHYEQVGAHYCSMFIMRVDLFCEYMAFWWDVMQKIEPTIDPTTRYLGWLSERLFTYWVMQKRIEQPMLRVGELPFLYCEEAKQAGKILGERGVAPVATDHA
jgi:hypothetical protein